MKYSEFQHILSGERLQRYLLACDNNTRKTMTLYRLNLNLSQEVFTLLSCFEVAVRNAIDRILTERLGENWLRDAVLDGGIFDVPGYTMGEDGEYMTMFNHIFNFGWEKNVASLSSRSQPVKRIEMILTGKNNGCKITCSLVK